MVSGYRMRQGILAVRRKSFQGHEVCNCPDSAAPVFAFLGIAGCVGRQTGYPVMTRECIGVGQVSTKPVNPMFWYYASQQRPIRANRLNIRQRTVAEAIDVKGDFVVPHILVDRLL